jgi:cytochrome c oxidase subunit 2
LEIIWTVIPTIVLVGLIVYGLAVWDEVIYAQDDQENPQRIEVYGKQFQWLARYPGEDGNLGAANYKFIKGTNAMGLDTNDVNANDDIITYELHMVVDKPVHLTFRSQDVLHSAYLPHFRVQMNCVPGMVTQFGFTPNKTTEQIREEMNNENFDYVVICNKICGAAHYTMKMIVKVESQEEYDEWLGQQPVFYAAEPSTAKDGLIVEKEKDATPSL